MRRFNIKSCIEIYIINECNLTCKACNRYNNYDFRGYYTWEGNRDTIRDWSQRITAPLVTLIGGEPSLHPELELWAEGVAAAWPDSRVMIQTNGIKPVIELPWWGEVKKNHKNLGAGIAIHSEQMADKIQEKWQNIGGKFDAHMFTPCTLIEGHEGFRVHDSEPAAAWEACGMKHSHTILDGRLYRCPMVAVLPEFRKQFRVNLTAEQESLLYSYESLGSDCSDDELEEFISSVDTSMPQCSLCPDDATTFKVDFDPARKKFPRRTDVIEIGKFTPIKKKI